MAFQFKRIFPTGKTLWDIYTILWDQWCPSLGITLSNTRVPNYNRLLEDTRHFKYFRLDGTDPDGKQIIITVLDRDETGSNEFATKTEKFRTFIHNLKAGPDTEIVIIAPCAFQTHVLSYIHGTRKADGGAKKDRDKREERLAERLSIYHWDRFKVVLPLMPHCSQAEIMTPDEEVEELKRNVSRADMKKIFRIDPQNEWTRAKPGQIIRLTRINPITGHGGDYRRMV